METFYHGTAVKGLETLIPNQNRYSNLSYPCVYLAETKPLAAIYIWNKPYKWMSYGFGADGIPVITESFPNHLYEFYNGVSGCIYTCIGDYVRDYAVGIKYAAISKEPIRPTECDIVENAYERLVQYETDNKIKIRRFEELPQSVHDGRRRTVFKTIRELNLLQEKHPLAQFVKEKFPELWELARNGIFE